jgi:Icc-related predicted phosphoesterase
MKIQYCSDLHLEFPANKKFLDKYQIKPVGEILLLAGDILPFSLHTSQKEFIDYVAGNFEMVYWVPGNHEYYGYDLGTVADPLLEKIRSNVWLLNNQIMAYRNINFICSTLWSRISPLNALDIQRSISDFFEIKWQGKKFTTREFNQLHHESILFLKNSVQENSGAKNIIVTHHVPTLYHYPARFRNSPLNEAFAVELYDFIHSCNAMYWIYGHHHSNTPEFSIGNTGVVTNQLGYVQRNEQLGFNVNACIEI